MSASALVAIGAWAIAAIVLLIHGAMTVRRHSVIETYMGAGRNWLAGQPLYEGSAGFVYSPLVAALFSPLTFLPPALSHPLWIAISIAGYLGAIGWSLRESLFQIGREKWALVFLLILPLSIGNFSNGQVNPIVIALLLGSVVAVHRRWMTLAAFCVALAVYFKIYPIAMGLVLMAVYPRNFSWRFLLAMAALAALSFVLQRPSYVLSQYHLWFATRTADNRHAEGAVRDVFMILKALQVPVSERGHTICQALSGGAIAVIAFLGRFRFRWTEERVLVAIFFLVDAWMLLFGPATESATYVMLAPAVAIAVVQSFRSSVPGWMNGLAVASFAILLLGTGINSFLHLPKTPTVMSVQPLGGVVFAAFALCWIFNDKLWSSTSEPQRSVTR